MQIQDFVGGRRGELYKQSEPFAVEFYLGPGSCGFLMFRYVSLRLRVQNAVPAQPCVGKLGISLVLLNFLHCNFRLWFKTP